MPKIWEVQLKQTYLNPVFMLFFFLTLKIFAIYAAKETELENGLTIFFFYCSFLALKQMLNSTKNYGWIAILSEESLIYWKKQRFKMVRSPFLTPFVVILCLRSISDNHNITLLVFAPQMSAKSWRTFHFMLQGLIIQNKRNKISTRSNRFD